MDKNIYELQNQDSVLKSLVVQSKIYSNAKRLNYLNFTICVLLPIFYTFAQPFFKSEVLISLGIISVIALFYISNQISKSALKAQKSAAKVQQTIDHFLFEDDSFKTKNDDWGELYSDDELIELISKTKMTEKDIQLKKNWYADYSSFPHVMQSYYSQRESVRWDGDLRKRFTYFVCVSITALVGILLIISIAFKMTVFEIIINIGTFLPIFKFIYSMREKSNKDIKRLDNIKYIQNTISNSFGVAIGAEELYAKEIKIQDKLYEHRKSATMIPDFFYKMFRNKQEDIEEKIAQNEKDSKS